MADFRGYVTAAGQQFEALAKQMNYPVTIGFVEIGDGRLPDDQSPIARTKLVNKLKEFPAIVEQDPKNPGQFVVTCYIPADDSINGNGYFIREMGCRLIGQGAGILYSYRRVSDDWKPVISSGEAKSYIYKLRFIPTYGELITPTIDPSIVLVDKEELERRFLKHSSEEYPHLQYAKKANVPVALDNMQKMAAALGNNPNYAADQAVAMLGKLAKSMNGADIPNVAMFLQNLGIKTPTDRNGITAVQAGTGYVLIPVKVGSLDKTLIFQWGKLQLGTGAADYNCDIVFPIPYTDACFAIVPGSGVLTDDYEKNAAYRTLKQSVSIGIPSRYGADAQLFADNGTGHSRYVMWISVGF